MQSITLQARVDDDGILRLQVPVDVANTNVEVVIVFQTMKDGQTNVVQNGDDWKQFIKRTAGSLPDFPDVGRTTFGHAEGDEIVQAFDDINKHTEL